MEHFLINSTICLFALWLAYKLLLENTSWHVFKRIYLLGAILVAFIIPFLVVKTVVIPVQEIPVLEFQNSMARQQVTEIAAETGFTIDWVYVALGLYMLGVCIILFRFTKNLLAFQIQKNDEVSSYKGYRLILRDEVLVPHSFWKRIFVSKKHYEQDLIPTVVLEHEKTHLDQRHSLDVLFVELLLVLFWFNPVLYTLRYAIKLNHEFLADQAVLKTGIPTKVYQELILNHATNSYHHAMANTFTFPFIKKRFTIMKTQTSHRSLLLRSVVLIPIVALLIVACGKEKIETEKGTSAVANDSIGNYLSLQTDEEPIQKAAQENDINTVYASPGEKVTIDSYYAEATIIVYGNGVQYNDTILGTNLIYQKKYKNFTQKEKADLQSYALLYVPKPTEIRIPTEDEMKEYLNEKVFRIWIDGKELSNSKLNDYTIADFKSYSDRMFVHKTGRKVHPQAFNVMFYTHAYYEDQNMGRQIKYYPSDESVIIHKDVERIRKNYNDSQAKQSRKTESTNTNSKKQDTITQLTS